jgi:tetratricopeptide (TPR) repeat protein
MRKLLLLAALLAPLPALAQAPPLAPSRPDARPDGKRGETDALLDALRKAETEEAAAGFEAKLRESWLRAGAPVAALLLGKGTRNLRNDADDEALDDFDAALTIDPDYMEAYNRRAVARSTLGDYRGALADISEVLRREPRHFGALQTLSRIAEARGDSVGALAAWEKVIELAPNLPGTRERLKVLRSKALGEES